MNKLRGILVSGLYVSLGIIAASLAVTGGRYLINKVKGN